MKANSKFLQLIERIQEGHVMTREECEFLLGFDEKSLEAGITRSVADSLSRELFNNKGLVFGQIGVEIAPCPGKCKFCSFSEDFTSFQSFTMDDEYSKISVSTLPSLSTYRNVGVISIESMPSSQRFAMVSTLKANLVPVDIVTDG